MTKQEAREAGVSDRYDEDADIAGAASGPIAAADRRALPPSPNGRHDTHAFCIPQSARALARQAAPVRGQEDRHSHRPPGIRGGLIRSRAHPNDTPTA